MSTASPTATEPKRRYAKSSCACQRTKDGLVPCLAHYAQLKEAQLKATGKLAKSWVWS